MAKTPKSILVGDTVNGIPVHRPFDSQNDRVVAPDGSGMIQTRFATSEALMLASNAQVGDLCVRTDLNKLFVLKIDGASTIANWHDVIPVTESATIPLAKFAAWNTPGSYTWVCPVGVTSVFVTMSGGGGGGWSATIGVNCWSGSGGGGAASVDKAGISVIPGNTYNVVVGSGGLAYLDGQDSSFGISGNIITCAKGKACNSSTTVPGISGGAGGGDGGLGQYKAAMSTTETLLGGAGGNTLFGQGGQSSVVANASSGLQKGAGGAGAGIGLNKYGYYAAGKGADGFVRLDWFYPQNVFIVSVPATYTWTCPSNVTSVLVSMAGGGGGGVCGYIYSPGASGGAGGGGGAAVEEYGLSVSPGTTYTVVVGSGGAQYYPGTASSFSSPQATLLSCAGGGAALTYAPFRGAAGGNGGEQGKLGASKASTVATDRLLGGDGGSTVFGAGGVSVLRDLNDIRAANTGSKFGAGGAGGSVGNGTSLAVTNGGAGANGFVMIKY